MRSAGAAAVNASASAVRPAPHTGVPVERFLDYDQSLACIHCGLCLASCPTYLETGNENDSPRGRIYLMRAVQDGRLPLGDTAVRHIDLCLGCRACEAACPSGVPYGELLEHTRDHIEKHYRRSAFQNFLRRVAIEQLFPFPSWMKLALLPVKLLRALRAETLLPKFAREALSLVPERTNRVSLPELSPATTEPKRGRVGFVSGCVMSVLFGETNANSVRLLNRAGCDVVTPPEQVCCGALYAHGGNLASARDCARRNIEIFERHALDAIIINAAGCGSTLKEYAQLLRDDPAWAERGRKFSAKVKDLTEFLVSCNLFNHPCSPHPGPLPQGEISPHWCAPCAPERSAGLRPGAVFSRPIPNVPGRRPALQVHEEGGSAVAGSVAGQSALRAPHTALRITYHDACHLAHPQRITQQPRD